MKSWKNWLARLLNPHVDFVVYEYDYDGCHIVVFQVDPAQHMPVKFNGEAFIRLGSYKRKLKDFPERAENLVKSTR